MKNNKKGFTLVELLAVILVLIIIILIAINKVRKVVDKSADNSTIANAQAYIKAADDILSVESIKSNDLKDGAYSISDLQAYGLKIEGTMPDKATIITANYEIVKACLEYGKYKVEYDGSNYSNPVKGKCSNSSGFAQYVYDYNALTSPQEFVAPLSGTYRLEAWGAQGGSTNSKYFGGYGGYAVGYITLEKDDVLYVNVGGAGVTNSTAATYNGGGSGHANGASGGGATSISLSPEIIKVQDLEDLLLIAGGGGGAVYYQVGWASSYGGHGGGYVGNDSTPDGWSKGGSKGGTQTEGGRYGLSDGGGQSGNSGSFADGGGSAGYGNYVGGGGGGLYGGGSGRHAGGAGGSGYINTTLLTNPEMYCYDCSESSEAATKTTSVTCSDPIGTSKCAKQNEGHARISLVI